MNLFEHLDSLIAAVVSGGAAFLFTRKKYSAEVSTNELDNVKAALEIYKTALDDLEMRFKKRILEVEEELSELRAQLKKCKDDVMKQINDN